MLVSNCNEAVVVPCNCTVSFSPPAVTPSINGLLDVGRLVGVGCTSPITNYIIDWYIDGILVLTTGSDITYSSDIVQEHPFSGVGNAIPAPYYGTYYPVVRKFEMAGEDIYGTPARCKNYCQLNSLPPVVVQKIECGVVGDTPDTGYSFRIYYKPSQPPSRMTQSFPFGVTTSNNYQYVAIKFFVGAVEGDTFRVYYNNGETRELMAYYSVGRNFSTNEITHSLNGTTLLVVLDFTEGRTVEINDVLNIEVESGNASDTEWYFNITCLTTLDLEISPGISQCNYFNVGLRQFKLSGIYEPIVTFRNYETAICGYEFKFYLNQVLSSSFSTSNLKKYTSITEWVPNFLLNANTGEISAYLYDKITTSNYAVRGSSYYSRLNEWYTIYYDPDASRLEQFYYDKRDLDTVRTNGRINHNGLVTYSRLKQTALVNPDKTSLYYYKWAYLSGGISTKLKFYEEVVETLECGDTSYGQWSQHFPVESQFSCYNNIITETSVSYMDSQYDDMVEIRFKSLEKRLLYTTPSISFDGNLQCYVLNKINNDPPYYNITNGALQEDAILIRGNTGTLTFSGPGGLTQTLTLVGGSLKDAVQTFISQSIIEAYAKKKIEISAYTQPEIRFRPTTLGSTLIAPTVVVSGTGANITATVVKRSNQIAASGSDSAVSETYSILLSGTTGTVTIFATGGITTSFTATGNLANALQTFIYNSYIDITNPVGQNIRSYVTAGVIPVAYTGYIGRLSTLYYDGMRDDFNKYYPYEENSAQDILDCNRRTSVVLSSLEDCMSNCAVRTLTVNNSSPTADTWETGWQRGDIITGSGGATCEVVSWHAISGSNITYDIKNTIGGTGAFTVGETLQNGTGRIASFVSVSAANLAKTIAYTGCRNGEFPHGETFFVTDTNEIYKDFYWFYYYPLASLNTLCSSDPQWVLDSTNTQSRYYLVFVTLNFHRTDLEVGKTAEQINDIRENNFEIYTRLNYLQEESGDFFSILQLNVAPSSSWNSGDIVYGSTSNANCRIVSGPDITGLRYYVDQINGTFRDAEMIGTATLPQNKIQQTYGAPRIVGNLVYRKDNGVQSYPPA